MRWILCLMMLAALGFAPAPVYKPKASEKDLDLLQGKWDLVAEKGPDGVEKPATPEGKYLIVKGIVFECHHGNGSHSRYRLEIDATKKQGALELHALDRVESAEKPFRGLYRLTRDELILCLGASRGEAATSIEGGKGIERYLFKRAPKP